MPANHIDDETRYHLAGCSPAVHFETCAKIKDAKTKAFFRPTANILQRRIQEAYEVLTVLGYLAIRIIVTKIRQCGGTTVSQHTIYHKCKATNADALVIADTVPRARMVLERFREFDAHDRFPWNNPLVAQATNMQWSNGSTATITSAESRNPGIAAPRQAILFSESCKYPRGGVVDDKDIVASVMPSLNDAGLAIAESTPEGACYDAETEILTNEGWKLFAQLTGNESILTKDSQSDNAYYQPDWTPQVHKYTGPMVRIETRTLDFLVTPKHKMWVACSHGKMRFRNADKLASSTGDYYFDRSFKWNRPDVQTFTLPKYSYIRGYGHVRLPEISIPMDIWLRFFGQWLADGGVICRRRKCGRCRTVVYVTQVKFIQEFEEAIEALRPFLQGNIVKKPHRGGWRWNIYDCQLAHYLSDYSQPKRIPRELLMSLSQGQCRDLLAAIYEGDGDQMKARANKFKCGRVYVGIDSTMADDTQELALKAGYASSKGGPPRNQIVTYRDCKRAKLGYLKTAKEQHYHGMVYCVTLPKDHLLMVRRKGKAAWCGNSGWHYDTWQGALPLDEFIKALKAGEHRPGNGWVKVFAAWFEFEENQHPVTAKMREHIDRTLTNREQNGIEKYGWTHEQIYWRRSTLQGECGGSEDLFDEYYPEDEVSCFLSSGRPRFNMASVMRLEKAAQSARKEIGTLTEQESSGVVQFIPDLQGMASFHVWERPRAGCRYVVWCDPATGEDQTESNDPDRHSIGVLRCEVTDDRGSYKDAVVARVRPPFTGNTLLASDYITLLSRYYGNAIVVLEINMGLHILERLKDEGIPIYQRQVIDPFEREAQKFMFGWKLKDRDQRRTVVDCLALAIYQESIVFNCPHIAGEARTFIIDKNGKEIARSGCKDDDIMGLAMALYCKGSGTLYHEPKRRRRNPSDHKQWRAR